MKVTFHGVRGSLATPGVTTVKYGGNTSSVSVELDSGQTLLLDAGTGIARVPLQHINNDFPIILLLTHTHWDHINGFPFFAPIHQSGRHIYVCTGSEEASYPLNPPIILQQMNGIAFPLKSPDLNCDFSVVGMNIISAFCKEHALDVETISVNHPGGGTAYLIRDHGTSVAYITDNELNPPYEVVTDYAAWVSFLHGVDILIHDAQYINADMPAKHGWGHSLISEVRQLAIDAEVKTLCLFHHDPERTDQQLDDIQRENEQFFKGVTCPTQVVIAQEGMTLEISQSKSNPAEHFISIKTA